jgi:hypothetical protein
MEPVVIDKATAGWFTHRRYPDVPSQAIWSLSQMIWSDSLFVSDDLVC